MKKAERTYIENRVKQFERWACEERREAEHSSTEEERDEHLLQERLNQCAADTLYNLLIALTAPPSSR